MIITFIQKAIGQGIGILFGANGEILTEKSGNLNLGVPGMMYMGGIAGLAGAFLYEKAAATPIPVVGFLIALVCALLAGALGVPVAVMETAGEGGPWGMALLAAYCVRRAEGQTLEEYLADTVFRGAQGSVQQPDAADTAGFARFLTDYKSGLAVEKAAAAALR